MGFGVSRYFSQLSEQLLLRQSVSLRALFGSDGTAGATATNQKDVVDTPHQQEVWKEALPVPRASYLGDAPLEHVALR